MRLKTLTQTIKSELDIIDVIIMQLQQTVMMKLNHRKLKWYKTHQSNIIWRIKR